MSQLASLLLVNNGCDALLKRYRLLYCRRSCAAALGYTGLCNCLPAEDWTKVAQVDACCHVGRRHTFDGYICSVDLMARMRPYLMFEGGTPTKVTMELGLATADSATEEVALAPVPLD